ncbi:hypothetical protein ACWEKT_28960 [Nocardia takedensis]
MRWVLTGGAAIFAVGLLTGCGSEPGTPTPVSAVVVTSTQRPEVERNLRIREHLQELGCTTNSCIQTYFACMDGYLTGEPCEFYRQHPP